MTMLHTMSRKAIAPPHAHTDRTIEPSDASAPREPRRSVGSDDLDLGGRRASTPAPRNLRRWWALFAILPFVTSVAGCGLLAAPCRVASAGLKIIPGVGGALATPTDACAAAID
ncbi:lipoprotein [Pandoraea anapnoica]|uniref:Lipoprotein n=1 Tax=Pandoraea anapnoica TaxID=2508301 RepID=A0A5E4ZGG5_9BURK|nr:lipoprotein [Pandoraea anapnoica]